jgi:glycosyltransferase involved in cell wall biosynthesis
MPGPNRAPVVLFVNHWARRLGGAEFSLLDILTFMAPRGVAHLLVSEDGELVEKARRLGVTCHIIACKRSLAGLRRGNVLLGALRSWRGMISFARFVLATSRLVRQIGPDLIHANVPKSHVTLFLVRALGYRGACCFHMREIFDRRSLPWLLYRLLWPKRNSHLLSISQAVKDHLPEPLRSAATVVYNGVRVPAVRPDLPSLSSVRFLYLGRIVPWKGCHLLVESFRLLRTMRPRAIVELDLVGDTMYWDQDYRSQLGASIEEHGLSSSCMLRPHTRDPYGELVAHHVLCMASWLEPFGRTAAEAQACGRPVIASDSGGVGEIVVHNQTGILVEYGNTQKFADAMASLVDDPCRIGSLGAAGYARTGKLFNRDVQMVKICDRLVELATGLRQDAGDPMEVAA